MIYVIGSLKTQRAREVARRLRDARFEVFDDWQATAPDTDKHWTAYEKARGRNLRDALQGKAGRNQFAFDEKHLNACKAAVLVMPCGKSAHLELGYIRGLGKPGFVLFDKDPDEFDLMYGLASEICYSEDEVIEELRRRGFAHKEGQ